MGRFDAVLRCTLSFVTARDTDMAATVAQTCPFRVMRAWTMQQAAACMVTFQLACVRVVQPLLTYVGELSHQDPNSRTNR